MNFLELALKRQSVRKYSNKDVERDKIERCIEAVRIAPSACNSQPWKFIIITDKELKEKIAKATFGKLISFNHFAMQAPVIVVQISEKSNFSARIGGILKKREFRLIDNGIAAEHFCLQAASEDLGTCMIGWFNEKKIKKILSIPKNKRVELVITLGYPENSDIRDKKRKSMENISSFNQY